MGPNKSDLQYRTFDSLLADVLGAFKTYDAENLVDPQELYGVVKWVTKDLGLKVFKTKECVLELNHCKVRLPDDFFLFNYGLLCGEKVVRTIDPQGTTMLEIPYPGYSSAPAPLNTCATQEVCGDNTCGKCNQCVPGLVTVPGYNPLYPYGDPCVKPRVFMNCKGESFELIQVLHTQVTTWKYMLPLRLVSSNNLISPMCPNLGVDSLNHIWIKDNFLNSNLKSGTLYINYEGNLEDEQGNLMVPDHDLLNPFYEYKLKVRILENLWANGEDVKEKLLYFKNELRIARFDAQTVVNMPEFSELEKMWKLNRLAFNSRYVDMFKSCNWMGAHGARFR